MEVTTGQWRLTGESFDRLLSLLDADDRERAGERYEMIRRKLLKFFEWRGSASPDDDADATLNRVARKLDSGEEIRHPESYFLGVARLVWLENVKAQARARTALEQLPNAGQSAADTEQAHRRLACFESCLEQLSADNHHLIVEYHREEKGAKIARRKELADQLGMPLNALRIRAHRLRQMLAACVQACLDRPQP